MSAINDALNLAVGATTHVHVKAADKWHILNARCVSHECVYFSPAGADDVTRIRCEMEQGRLVLLAMRANLPGDKLDLQIGLMMACIHDALEAAGVSPKDAEAAVFRLLDEYQMRNNPLFHVMRMCKGSTLGFSLRVQGQDYVFFVRKYASGYAKLETMRLDKDARFEWQHKSYVCWKAIQKQQPNENRALEQHVLSSIRGILDMLKVPGDEIDGILKKIKDEYDEHGGYDD